MLKFKIDMIKLEFKYHLYVFKFKKTYKDKVKYIKDVIMRNCGNPYCPKFSKAKFRGQNTMYENNLSNYNFLCRECHEEVDAMWQEMWDEYNSGRL